MITTNRLLLRPVQADDAGFFLELLTSETWLKYIGDRGVYTEADALHYLEKKVFPTYNPGPPANWLVCLRETGVPIGTCGLYKRPHLEHHDLGFAFLPAFHGQGYGFEAATASMEFAAQELGMTRLLAITIAENHASIGLLKKLGFQEQEVIKVPDDEEELLLFSHES